RAHNPEMRKAMKAYTQENVLPVMQTQRAKLDASLSRSEQKELEDIRTELAELKAEIKAMRKKGKPQGEPSEAQRSAKQAHHKAMRQLMTRAWAIADAHEAKIQSLFTEIEPQAKVWKEEMRNIAEQYRPEDAPQRPEGEDHPEAHHRQRGPRGMKGMRALHSPVRFVLWDGNAPLEEARQEEIRVFPNPARNNNEVRLRLEEAGQVKIQILNKDGELVRTVVNEQKSAGEHTQSIDLQGLEPGLYFYQIQTPRGTRSRKVIIE
ncbi:MAG: T9SS type A sorting domain-containing protein, partial [Bacteroidota bacterium]